jgi:membrane protease YdiL (CAAX protease family)
VVASLILLALNLKHAGSIINNANITALYLLLESGILFLILAIILQSRREEFKSLGLHWNQWKSDIALGVSLVPLFFLINLAVVAFFKAFLPQYYAEENPLSNSIHTPGQLALFIFAAIIAGGIKEELQRAFILNRFREYLGGAEIGLIVWSLVFGIGHFVQGVQGVVIASILGMIFGAVYIARGSILAPIVAHGIYDSLALLFYWFFSNRLK